MGFAIEGSLIIIVSVFVTAVAAVYKEKTRPDTQDELEELEFWRSMRDGEI